MMGRPQVAALTATATPRVREDILKHLGLDDPVTIVRGFARENLHFRITACDTHKDKYKRLYELVKRYKTGIIYCSTRKKWSRYMRLFPIWIERDSLSRRHDG